MSFPTASFSIAELLSSPFLLNIPVYQRPYSWGREHVEQLFDDLLETSGLAAQDDADPGYFLGTILLMDTPGNVTTKLSAKLSPREFDVVDGQQRLASLLTLFAVLRDLETDARKPVSKRVNPMLFAQLGSRFFRTERHRLHLAGADRALFEQSIVAPGSSGATPATVQQERPLLVARDLFRALAEELSEADRKRLCDFIADQCHVIVIVSHDIDRAHRTFVVLNERGKKLQKNDILKADLLSRLPEPRVAAGVNEWDTTSQMLGDDFEQFFAHLRTVYGYSRPQIVSGVRAVIREVGGAEAFFDDVFKPLANSYALIRSSGDSVLPPSMRRRLMYLNRLPDGDWAPAAMLALRHWPQEPEYAQFLLAEVDRLAHLLRMLCAGTGKRIRRFAEVVSAIRSGEAHDRNHAAFQITRDEARNIAFHLKDLHERNPKVCKLLLLRLSDELRGEPSGVDPDLYTIEHVLPQRPSASSVWRQWFPTAEERSQIVDSLGNLVLITKSQNDRAKNASWDAKKQIYLATTEKAPLLPITRDVLDAPQWRRFEIEAREQKLFEIIETLWRIDLKASRSMSRAAE